MPTSVGDDSDDDDDSDEYTDDEIVNHLKETPRAVLLRFAGPGTFEPGMPTTARVHALTRQLLKE